MIEIAYIVKDRRGVERLCTAEKKAADTDGRIPENAEPLAEWLGAGTVLPDLPDARSWRHVPQPMFDRRACASRDLTRFGYQLVRIAPQTGSTSERTAITLSFFGEVPDDTPIHSP
ncbi:MAG: hypothetical protein EOM91_22790, partial [Sphingobacteriia bacterium]|nr:hypothetical protein [Sphingobacteriia bacterium]